MTWWLFILIVIVVLTNIYVCAWLYNTYVEPYEDESMEDFRDET